MVRGPSILSSLSFPLYVISKSGAEAQFQVNSLVGVKGASTIQCRAVDPPFTVSAQAGTVEAKIQSIGKSSGSTIVSFNETAVTNAGIHPAPAPQWVLVLKGHGLITLSTTNATLELDTGAIIIANDTKEKEMSNIGHNTDWSEGSVAVQLPFQGGIVPNHTVVKYGPCDRDTIYGNWKISRGMITTEHEYISVPPPVPPPSLCSPQ